MKQSQSQQEENLWRVVQELDEVIVKKSPWKRTHRDERIVKLLNDLVEFRQAAALPAIARCLFQCSKTVAKAARLAISNLLKTVSSNELIRVRDSFSWSYGWYVTNEWQQLSPRQVASLAGEASEAGYVDVLGLLSFHHSGYVRHAAVKRLSQCSTGEELRYLILRQNDWVDVIARDAKHAVSERLNDRSAQHLFYCLPLILHLNKKSRHDHSETVQRAISLFFGDQNESLLRDSIYSTSRDVRRLVVKFGLQQTGRLLQRTVELALQSDDPILRLMCCPFITTVLPQLEARTTLEKLSEDKFMPVRRMVARIRADFYPEQREVIWRHALLDRSRSIRELSQFTLRQLGHTEVAESYRDAIAENPELFPALEGLADCGEDADVPFFSNLLSHQLPSRRVVAIRALVKINNENSIQKISSVLEDESPRVLREVRKFFQPYLYLLSMDQLLAIALESDSSNARENAARILSDCGKWRGLPWLLKVVGRSDLKTSQLAADLIEEWFTPPQCNRVFTQPSQTELQEIQQALSSEVARIPKETYELLSTQFQSNN